MTIKGRLEVIMLSVAKRT